ncbi:endochitinase [Metarhizium rileyi]|uniref:chitinase n=1 Tax=Metarhizium rileyi (strain RCEF 4871) TaxID=1649241 RepID=A0A166XQK6_METRR|nr:endochitinase [Metarhizium rileyi RCEF 4871]TWU72950.1 hypothetical protein ED733_003020 [Metarhizium rileyi]
MRSSLALMAAVLSPLVSAIAIPSQEHVIVGYYPTWKHNELASLDLNKYTHINVAFAIPDEKAELKFDGDAHMSDIVSRAHTNNATKVLVSLGGWTGSIHFSNITKSPELSQTLTDNIIRMMTQHQLDGIDIDWEFPGENGSPCNFVDETNDVKNFLVYLQSLRTRIDETFTPEEKLITLAVRVKPFSGLGDTNLADFAKVVDFANIMAYDINGPWMDTTGPNAPLNFEQGKGTQLSFASSIDQWVESGWPANQLTAGLAFYGHSLTSSVDMTLTDPPTQYEKKDGPVPKGASTDEEATETCPENSAKPDHAGAKQYSGVWTYAQLRQEGALDGPTTAKAPWVRAFDNVTMTPWLFQPENKTFVSYDDPISVKIKTKFARSKGLRGVMLWDLAGDFQSELTKAINSKC